MVAPPRRPSAQPKNRQPALGQVRIVGGRWRGTKLPVHDSLGLRPTSDRVRETLFNWLTPALPGSTCVDVFAGSGALGFEAASRGAARVILIERQPLLAANLEQQASRIGAEQVEVVTIDALRWLQATVLQQNAPRFDIAFIDPPFELNLWDSAVAALMPLMSHQGMIYVESALDARLVLPAGLVLHREGRTRDTAYRLFRVSG